MDGRLKSLIERLIRAILREKSLQTPKAIENLKKLKVWVRGRDHLVEHAFFVLHNAYATIGNPRPHVELTEYFVLRSVMFRRLWLPRLGWFVDHFILPIALSMDIRVSAFHLLQKLNSKHPTSKVENMIRHLKTVKKIGIEDVDVMMARQQEERSAHYRRIGKKVGKLSGRMENIFKTMQECFDIVVPKVGINSDSSPSPSPSPPLLDADTMELGSSSVVKKRDRKDGGGMEECRDDDQCNQCNQLEWDDAGFEDGDADGEHVEESRKTGNGKEEDDGGDVEVEWKGYVPNEEDIFGGFGSEGGEQLWTEDGMWMDTQAQQLLWAVGEDMEISLGNPLLGENVSRSYSVSSSRKSSGEADSRAKEVEVIIRRNLVQAFRKMHQLKQKLQELLNQLRSLLEQGITDDNDLDHRIAAVMKESEEFSSKCEHFGVDVFDLEDAEDGDNAFGSKEEGSMTWEDTHLAGEGVELKYVINGEKKSRFVPKQRLLHIFPQHKHAQSIARNKETVERNRKILEDKERVLKEESHESDGFISVANITGMEVSHRFLGSGRDLDEKEIAAPKHRPFVMDEHTMPVLHKKIYLCRYPIMKGVLCTLSSRGRCVLHGKIVPRDLEGNIQPGELQWE
eukprot:TRINITY_DN15364_c0_g1_i1.p1 TRINITY_DN15364_c0_g1~~TRINITY_DN15364_c0_g1_i1.p1  ORF type:complete len:624 (+),score=215.16 TRINITY_DN15364_c0_g1_i1:70-1941(+)